VSEAEWPRGRSEVRTTEVTNGIGVVQLIGEHDLSTASEVRNSLALLLESGADVVVDLSETRFIDCSIIHALEDGEQLAERRGVRVILQSPTHVMVRRVLELTGARQSWPVYGTRGEAIEALRPAPFART
jgi:anti-sigma B factor antagonist